MIIFCIALIAFIYLLAKYVLLPYKNYLFYRKYGKGKFFPIFGEYLDSMNSLKKYGDEDYTYQHIHDEGDNQKIYVCNFGNILKGFKCFSSF